MFNLFRSRDKMVRYLLGGLLVLVSLSMLTYLIPSYNTGYSSSDTVVAEIGKESISLPEVQKTIQAALRGKQLPPEFVPHYVPEVIRGLIDQRAMEYEAKRMGFEISDAELVSGMKSILPPELFPGGKYVGDQGLAAYLSQMNLSIDEFETNMRRQLLITRLNRVVLEGTVVSPQEIEQEFHRKNDKVKLEYVKVSGDKYRKDINVTPEEVKAYFTAHSGSYMIPEKRNLGIVIINQAALEQAVHPTDAQLEAEYNRSKDQFRTPDRVKVRHILLTTTGKNAAEEAAIKAKAEDLLKQIRAGADFAKLAKENSQDPGSAQKGGELDWITHGQTVPEFDKEAFSLQPGQTSGLVKTQYGYHILQVEAKETARLKPFSEVKPQIEASYKKAAVGQQMQTLTDKAQTALKKDPTHPQAVAASLGLEFVEANNVGPDDPLPQIGVNKDFSDSLNGLKAGEVTQPVAVQANRVALASVTGVIAAHPATLAEVENKVRDALVDDKLSQLTKQKARELLDKTKSMNGDLEKAAKSMGLETKTVDGVTRTGAVEGLGSANYVSEAFSKPDGAILGPLEIPGQIAVVKVLSHSVADPAGLAGQRDSLRDQLKSRKAGEREKLFEAGLVDALTRQGKIKIHKDVVSRLEASFRG